MKERKRMEGRRERAKQLRKEHRESVHGVERRQSGAITEGKVRWSGEELEGETES